MKIPFTSFNAFDILATTDMFLETFTGDYTTNSFLTEYLENLKEKQNILANSHEDTKQKELTSQAKEMDDSFDTQFVTLRDLVETKAEIVALGGESEASEKVAALIKNHSRNVHTLPRHSQLSTMEKLIEDMETEDMLQAIDVARVKPLVENLLESHKALKEIETQRSSLKLEAQSTLTFHQASQEALTPLMALYNHVEDYAKINEIYKPLLQQIDTKLTPIVTQVKARRTRSESENN